MKANGRALELVRRPFLLIAFLATFCYLLPGQDATGRIVGTVTDSSGAVIPGAHVVVTNPATHVSRETETDGSGAYQVLSLPIGDYTVSADRKGFNPITTSSSKLEINQSLKIDITLEIGTKTEVVTVESTAPTVETINPTLGSTVSDRSVQDLPLNGRNVLDLALLQPGVLPSDNPNNTGAASANTPFSVSGGRSDSNTFILDGGANNDLLDNGVVYNPNPDAVQEFKVLTSNFTAEYGRNSGGIVTVVTKSGTNNFHGSVYEYNRNDAYNANDFFSNFNNQPRGVLKRNQFGGTVGGPVVKNKLFFFGSYEGQRQTQLVPSGQVTVLTTQEAQGDFTNSTNQAAIASFLQANPFFQPDPSKRGAGPSDPTIIDPNSFDPVAKAYLKAGLIPIGSSAFTSFQNPGQNNYDQMTSKFDFDLTEKDHFTSTLGRVHNTQLNPGPGGIPGFNSNQDIYRQFIHFAYMRIVSPTMLNEFHFSAQRNDTLQYKPAGTPPVPSALGINITPDLPTGPARMDFPGLTVGFSIQGPSSVISNTFNFSDTFSWTHGKHTIKFGGSFIAFQNNELFDFIGNGLFDFGSSNGAGDPFANFLVGLPADFAQFPAAPSNIRGKSTFVFGQNEWHVKHNLVLTLGLRYEFSTPKSDTFGRTFDILPGKQSSVFPGAPVGLVFPGDQGVPTGANFPDKNDFAPRLGFAWQPFDSKTSVRGGFGVFYDVLKAEDNFQFNGQVPFASSAFFGFPGAAGGPFTFLSDPYGSTGSPNPFPTKPANHNVNFFNTFGTFGGVGVFFVDPHLRTPYTYQYNLSIEREVASKTTLQAAYVGSASRKLTSLRDVNPFDPATLGSAQPQRILNETPGNVLASATTDGSFGFLNEFTNTANASYNALQLSLRKQASSNLLGTTYFTLSYTYAHSIDDASGFRQLSSNTPAFAPHAFRASSDFDIRHFLVLSGGWDLPFHRGPRALVKGWSVYPILTWRTGFPLTATAGGFTENSDPGPSGAGDAGLANANLTGPIHYVNGRNPSTFTIAGTPTTGLYFLDPTAFSDTPTPPYGTAPRNVIRVPGRSNLDLTLAKVTPIHGDRASFEFRVDAFNIFNHTQFSNFDTNAADSGFGTVTQAYAPRILQLAAHIRF
ncbi:MAG: carboxypeptidase regulatory-like domain-containing protein [Acidobacteriia bacterium]|nr:carboxypeptidase regulatory-like domain-containing protein [Terriglobia bacterium]